MSEIELKAAGCPCEGNFAFGPVGPDPDAEANHTAWNIDCFNDDCLVEPHFEHPGPRAEAIALWNQRTPATPDAVIEPASNPCRLDAAVIERAASEAIVLIDEINKHAPSRRFNGINQPLHRKLATIRATLARALRPALDAREGG